MTEFNRSLAVIIGINDYSNGIHLLKTAKADAEELARILEQDYHYNKVILITDDTEIKPIRENLLKLLENTLPQENLTERDRLLFYFAGHGIARPGEEEGEEGPQGFIVPSDAHYDKPDSLISMRDIYEYLAKLDCRHLLVILDCCFAGAFRWASTRKFYRIPKKVTEAHYQRFTRFPAWEVITSSGYNQEALDFVDNRGQDENDEKHSPFAQGLFKALIGKADLNNDGVIIAPELYIYIRDYVEKSSLQRQTPGFFPLQKHDRGEYIFLIPGEELNLAPTPELNPENNPYRGLKPFEQQNAHLFFGRQELIQDLFTVVFQSQHRLTTVVGISGSGKSSLVKAGLIPCLKEDKETKWQFLGITRDDNKKIIDPIRPETNPYDSLAEAFNVIQTEYKINSNDLKKWNIAATAVNPLSKLIKQWSKNNKDVKLLLIIDQFEELITLASKISPDSEEKELNWWEKLKSRLKKTPTQSPSKISASEEEALQQQWLPFIELLANTIEECPQFNLVITLRSDFAPRFANSGFKSYWEASKFTVRPMHPDELRQAVINPATERALYFEPVNLVDTIVDEVYQMPGALPLLSFALSELYLNLYQRWTSGETENRALTLEDYQKLGRVAGSLTRRVNEEYKNLPNDAHRLTMRRIMLRMVEIEGGEAVRRRVSLSELHYPNAEENQRVEEVLKRLDHARLIVGGNEVGEAYVEPAHDFLVRSWDRLQNWITTEQENLVLQQLLIPASQIWKNQVEKSKNKKEKIQEPSRFLWNADPRLGQLEQILKSNNNWFNDTEKKFVQRSINKRTRNIGIRWSLTGLVIIGLSGLTFFADSQRQRAEKTLLQQSNALADYSQELFNQGKYLDALVEGLRAGIPQKDRKNNVAKQIAALQVVYEVQELNRLESHSSSVISVAFSPDGKTIVTGSLDGTIKLWNLQGEVIESLKGHRNGVNSVAFSPDGDNIASVGNDGTVKLWNLQGKEIKTLTGHTGSVNSVAFSPDGDTIASVGNDGTVKLWNLQGKEIKTLTGHRSTVYSIAFSPDGNTIATASEDTTVKLWNLQGEEIKTLTGHRSVAFSPDGNTITSADFYGTVKLWNLQGEEIKTLEGHDSGVFSVAFSPDGNTIAIASEDKTVKLWKWNLQGEEIKTLKDHGGPVYKPFHSLAFSPDGNTIATASDDKTVKLWNLPEEEIKTLRGHAWEVLSVAFSPDGNTIASASIDSTVKLWNLQGQEIKTLRGHDKVVFRVAFSPDSNTIATASWDNTVKLWNFDLNDLLIRGCNRARDYLKTKASEEDRDLCDGIGNGK